MPLDSVYPSVPANANGANTSPVRLYACDPSDSALAYDGDNTWSGAVDCWLVDADGVPVDDGESAIPCSFTYDHSYTGWRAVDVYGPDGNAIDLHETARGDLFRRCEQGAEYWIDSERAERRAEDRADFYRGDWR